MTALPTAQLHAAVSQTVRTPLQIQLVMMVCSVMKGRHVTALVSARPARLSTVTTGLVVLWIPATRSAIPVPTHPMMLPAMTVMSAPALKPAIQITTARQVRRWIVMIRNFAQPTVVIQCPDAPMYRWCVLLANNVIRQMEYAKLNPSAQLMRTVMMDSSATAWRPVTPLPEPVNRAHLSTVMTELTVPWIPVTRSMMNA